MSDKGLIPNSLLSINHRKNLKRAGNSYNFKDETGQRYGRLTVIACSGRIYNEAAWTCRCDCGKTVPKVRGSSLREHKTQSCGCLHSEKLVKANKNRKNQLKEKYQEIAQTLRNEGNSYREIAKWFTENEVPSLRGGKWHASTIKWMLTAKPNDPKTTL